MKSANVSRLSIFLIIHSQGFAIELKGQDLDVTIFETVVGHVRPKETHIVLVAGSVHSNTSADVSA